MSKEKTRNPGGPATSPEFTHPDAERNFSRRRFLDVAAAIGVAGLAAPAMGGGGHAMGASTREEPKSGASGEPYLNVRDFGARGDGKTDDTVAVQRALDTAGRQGGNVVLLPTGRYLLAGELDIPPETALKGIFQGPVSHGKLVFSDEGVPGAGTTLLALAGKGNEHGNPLITLRDNASVTGLSIYYPEKDRNSRPVPYPWTIRLRGVNTTVENVEMLNPWRGIEGVAAHRHLIRNVTGQPIRTGIYVDDIGDIGRIENVQFVPWWSQSRAVMDFTYHEGESYVFGSSAWQYVLNTFSYGYHIGYHFLENPKGSCNGNYLGIGADATWHAIKVDHAPSTAGLLITNGEFVSMSNEDVTVPGGLYFPDAHPAQIVVLPSHSGTVSFVNCAFWGPTHCVARISGSGSVNFTSCIFRRWDVEDKGLPAIDLGGSVGGVLVSGCKFDQPTKQIRLGPKVAWAVIMGNLFRGGSKIENLSRGDIQMGLNSAGAERLKNG